MRLYLRTICLLLIGLLPLVNACKSLRNQYSAAERQERSRQREDSRQRKRPGYYQNDLADSRNRLPVEEERRSQDPVRRSEDSDEPANSSAAARALPRSKAAKVVIKEAEKYLGVRYQWGGMSKSGVDCSGLMVLAFKAAGIELPRTSGAQYKFGTPVKRKNLQPGDLVFFYAGRRGSIGHSGLVTEVLSNGEVKFIHAMSSGVAVSSLNSAHWNSHYVSACRVLKD